MADEQIVEPLRISKQLRKKEEQLPDSEKKSRSIFNTLIDIYYRTGMEGTILTVSPSGKKIPAGILMTLSAPMYRNCILMPATGKSRCRGRNKGSVRDCLLQLQNNDREERNRCLF